MKKEIISTVLSGVFGYRGGKFSINLFRPSSLLGIYTLYSMNVPASAHMVFLDPADPPLPHLEEGGGARL